MVKSIVHHLHLVKCFLDISSPLAKGQLNGIAVTRLRRGCRNQTGDAPVEHPLYLHPSKIISGVLRSKEAPINFTLVVVEVNRGCGGVEVVK